MGGHVARRRHHRGKKKSKARRRAEREERRLRSQSEPLPEPLVEEHDGWGEWVEWGGALIWAMGFTAGGAPYGLSIDDFRDMNWQDEYRRGWARARGVLQDLCGLHVGPDERVEVGWVKKIGDGVSREAFAAEVLVHPGAVHDSGIDGGTYVVLLPVREDGIDSNDREFNQRTRTQLRVLARLCSSDLPSRDLPFCLDRLLEAYREHGGAEVTADQVRLHELCMAGAWYRKALAGQHNHPPGTELGRLRGMLRRAST